MKTSRFRAACAWIICAIVTVPPALSDAVCNKDYRPITAAEQARMKAVLESVRSALPAAPAGWQIAGTDDFSLASSLCQDYDEVPFSFEFTRTYRNVGNQGERDKIIETMAAREKTMQEQKQPRIDALQAKLEKLVKAQVALVEKGDYQGAQKYNAEMDRLQQEMAALMDAGRDPAQEQAEAKAYVKDTEYSIEVRVNPWVAGPAPGAAAMAGPAGAQSAWRWHVDDANQTTDNELYLFGTWKPRSQGGFRGMSRAGASLFAAHFIAVRVTSDPGRIRKTADSINFAKIAATLK